jgi:hypothetical protein
MADLSPGTDLPGDPHQSGPSLPPALDATLGVMVR